jgi:hypothetical protein
MHDRTADTMLAVIEHSSIASGLPKLDVIFYFLGYGSRILPEFASYALK